MKKLFTNDGFFSFVVIVGCIGAILYSLGCFLFWTDILSSTYVSAAIFMLFNGAFSLILLVSYKKHQKNLMKAVMGALLMSSFATICTLTFPVVYTFTLDLVCCFAILALTLIVLINHFIINADHHSKEANVRLNQLCALLIAIVAVVWALGWIPYLDSTVAIIFQFFSSIAVLCMEAAIVCVESRLDEYRLDRESAGWTEEKGYPEGYVHQNKKK